MFYPSLLGKMNEDDYIYLMYLSRLFSHLCRLCPPKEKPSISGGFSLGFLRDVHLGCWLVNRKDPIFSG